MKVNLQLIRTTITKKVRMAIYIYIKYFHIIIYTETISNLLGNNTFNTAITYMRVRIKVQICRFITNLILYYNACIGAGYLT